MMARSVNFTARSRTAIATAGAALSMIVIAASASWSQGTQGTSAPPALGVREPPQQAANLKDFRTEVLLPGIKINTSATDYFPIEQMQMSRFNGEHGELFGSPISAEMATQ